jgi:hypothetical protein
MGHRATKSIVVVGHRRINVVNRYGDMIDIGE